MARLAHLELTVDVDQAAALRRLREAFGSEQITVIDLQPTSLLDQDSALSKTPAQAMLFEEAS
jgi:hypothetical protein